MGEYANDLIRQQRRQMFGIDEVEVDPEPKKKLWKWSCPKCGKKKIASELALKQHTAAKHR